MKTCFLLGSLLSLSCGAFVELNPAYCDETGGCEMGVTQCDLAHHKCVPLGSLGPLPTVSNITPPMTRTNGGTTMTLTGSDFRVGMKVVINGDTAKAITPTVIQPTMMQFVMPAVAGLCGQVPVAVLDELGTMSQSTATLRMKYGNFRLQSVLKSMVENANQVNIGDLNSDMNPDVLLGYAAELPFGIFSSDGRLTLMPRPQRFGDENASYNSMMIVDANSDGKADIIARTKTTITPYEGTGNYSFSGMGSLTQANSAMAFAAIDGLDGLELIVGADDGNKRAAYWSYMTGTFYSGLSFDIGPISSVPGPIVAGDWNGDSLTDVALVSNADTSVFYWMGSASGGFGQPKQFTVTGEPTLMQAVDIDGDGKQELIVATSDTSMGQLVLAKLDGGQFVTTTIAPINPQPLKLLVADFDCDGFGDIVMYHDGGEKDLNVYLNSGNGSFAGTPIPLSMGGESGSDVAIGNLDNLVDMKPDVVLLAKILPFSTMTVLRNTSD